MANAVETKNISKSESEKENSKFKGVEGPSGRHEPPCIEGGDCPQCGECEICGLGGNDNTAYFIRSLDKNVCEQCAEKWLKEHKNASEFSPKVKEAMAKVELLKAAGGEAYTAALKELSKAQKEEMSEIGLTVKGMANASDADKAAFTKEKAEHPEFKDEDIWKIVADHKKAGVENKDSYAFDEFSPVLQGHIKGCRKCGIAVSLGTLNGLCNMGKSLLKAQQERGNVADGGDAANICKKCGHAILTTRTARCAGCASRVSRVGSWKVPTPNSPTP